MKVPATSINNTQPPVSKKNNGARISAWYVHVHSNREMFALPEVRAMLTGPDAREGGKALFEKRTPAWAEPQ